jgi:iron complex transport system permease protein
MILNSNETNQILYWMLGSFSGKTWEHVQIAFPLISLGIFSLYFFSRELNLLLFGESTAQNLGVNVERTKKILLVLGSFTVASAVAVSGTIGFVGLIVPHSLRLIVWF